MPPFSDACEAIEQASTERDVVIAVQRFFASIPAEERAQLPWGLFGKPIANVGDVALWAVHLVRDSIVDATQPGPAHGQAAEILKRASSRLVTLRGSLDQQSPE